MPQQPNSDCPVTVIIPAFNSHSTIERAVESILRQTILPREILIIDDGSTTPIESAFSSIPSFVKIVRQANGGAASARNRGLDEADSEYVAFLDADDYWLPTKLERQLSAFAEHESLGLVYSRFLEQVPHEEPALHSKRIRHFPEFDKCQRYSGRDVFDVACCVWTGTVVARRSTIGDQRFRSGFEPAEDREFWATLVEKCEVMCLSDALSIAVLEPGSLSRTNIERDCGNMLRVIAHFQNSLGWRGTWWWKRRTFRRWASEYLGQQSPAALRPAFWRLCYEPWSLEAMWVVMKSLSLTATGGFQRRSSPST